MAPGGISSAPPPAEPGGPEWWRADTPLKLIAMLASVAIGNTSSRAARLTSVFILLIVLGGPTVVGLYLDADVKHGRTATVAAVGGGAGVLALVRAVTGRKGDRPGGSQDPDKRED
jgi:hypothetical protein